MRSEFSSMKDICFGPIHRQVRYLPRRDIDTSLVVWI